LDFELDLDPSQNLSETSSFDAGLSEVATPEMNLNDAELPLDNLDDLSFDATVMDIEALDKELDFPASAASVNDEMMALDLPIDLGVAANHTESELADLDALADFDLDAALNPPQEFSSEITASGLNEFESMADSLNLDISAPLKEVADDSASALADFDLPELTIPDLPSAVDALVGDLGAGLDGVSELGSAASLDAADGLDDIGLDFDFDLNEESAMAAPLEASSIVDGMDAPLNDISLDLDVAATDTELDFAADDPVQTKIDLARAYIDMGDVEGAREILQEAMQEGNNDQQLMAKTLLSDL
ncbi:MAG: FimV/HubP family polar landmark protein, partial [Deefgea sp.]